MKKIAAILMVMAMAGCSSMGMDYSGRSNSAHTGASSTGPGVNQNPVLNSNGSLNIYHGG